MNILVISNLDNDVDSGLNYSVPASVAALESLDNVLWVDLTKNAFMEHWGKITSYHNINEFGTPLVLENLSKPFNGPDVVVFEGFYYIEHIMLSRQLIKKNIPYVIVPRCSLTSKALLNGNLLKRIKKKVAHLLLFNRFIDKSLAIQYLTEQERIDSEEHFKHKSFIIPNGFSIPERKKETFSKGIKAVFIGRQDVFQKGLDILLYSIANLRDELVDAGFHLDIYGPPRFDYKKVSSLIKSLDLEHLITNQEKGVGGKQKEEVLLNSDLFVLTSRFEGHPMGLIEALSYGLPVLITRGANMYDEVNETHSGFVCETDVNSVTSALKRVIAERDKFGEYGENARILGREYDWNKLAEKFHDDISELL